MVPRKAPLTKHRMASKVKNAVPRNIKDCKHRYAGRSIHGFSFYFDSGGLSCRNSSPGLRPGQAQILAGLCESTRQTTCLYSKETMPAHLEEILAVTRTNLANSKSAGRVREMEKRATEHQPRGFRQALKTRAESGSAIIAELKKASPSKGLIRAEFDPVALAQELELAGAAALSVLTDAPHFQGSLENLQKASAAVKIPCLRKDFIIDPIQIVEARAYGADAILLIMAALDDQKLRELHNEAKALGLDVLCEVHERDEMKRAAFLGFDLIGVNNRDLRSFEVNLENALCFKEEFPPSAVRVAESGIDSPATMAKLREAGYHAFLIGELLMRAPSPGQVLRELLA